MSAKLLQALTEDNPDLQKQIGCMTGIFQLFDRQQIVTGRRITNHSHNRQHNTGHSHINTGNLRSETNNGKYSSKTVNEKQRVGTESSRASFSSCSSSSTFSSLDYENPTRLETASFERIVSYETSSKDLAKRQPNASPQLGHSSVGFRDVVKGSMYKDGRLLSSKTTTREEQVNNVVKNRDSRRSHRLSKSLDGSHNVGINGNSRMPADFSESVRLLGKLREGSARFNDAKELPRSPYETLDRPSFSVTNDARRFSYDEREMSRSSFESLDSVRSNTKHEGPRRFSMDNREGLIKRSDYLPESTWFSKDLDSDSGKPKVEQSPQQEVGSYKQQSNIVAKLMGLEVMPGSNARIGDNHSFSTLSGRTTEYSEYKQNRKSSSPRTSVREAISPRLKSSNFVMKPISSTPLPIEPAPWRLMDSRRAFQKPVVSSIPPRSSDLPPSAYAKIDQRLRELEFEQLDEDLRALKHMLDTMEAKGFLESNQQEDSSSNFESHYNQTNQSDLGQNSRLDNRKTPQNDHQISGTVKSISPFESPIVIMKPGKHLERSTIPASSVSSVNGFSGPRNIEDGDSVDRRKDSMNRQMIKDPNQKLSFREPVNRTFSPIDKKVNNKNLKSRHTSTRSEQPRENKISSAKSSNSISPRLQQKDHEKTKQTRPSIPSSDLSKQPRKQSVRQSGESGLPGGKRKPKAATEIRKGTRSSIYQGDEISTPSGSNISSTSHIDMEVTSADRSVEVGGIFTPLDNWSPSRKLSNNPNSTFQKKPANRPSKDGSSGEVPTVVPEQPSPVSVLDASFDRDDFSSPVKNLSDPFKEVKLEISDQGDPGKVEWNLFDPLSENTRQDHSSKINRKKLENVENLVQKLRRLNSNHDESTTDYIASLCEKNNPDHRYISEILIASGLLLRDLESGFSSIQPHSSGRPINPDLFIVLEQTKTSSFLPEKDQKCSKISELNQEKVHRKFIFDAVNEILEQKFALVGPLPEPWLQDKKLVGSTLNSQRLLRELCSEVEKLQLKESSDCSFEGDDKMKNILFEDVMSMSRTWADSNGEASGVVLDIERMIFKDLVGEIVKGETVFNPRMNQSKKCRQLFAQ